MATTLKGIYNRFRTAVFRIWTPSRDEAESESDDDPENPLQEISSRYESTAAGPSVPRLQLNDNDFADDCTLVASTSSATLPSGILRISNGKWEHSDRTFFRRGFSKLRNSTEQLRKKSPKKMADIRMSDNKTIPTENFLSRLNDYNTYCEGGPERLAKRQNRKGELVVEGLLNIYWGLRTAIRLQLADDDEKIRPRIFGGGNSSGGEGIGENGKDSSGSLDLENAIWGKTRQRRTEKRRGALRLKVPDLHSTKDHGSGDEPEVDDVEGGLARTSSVIMRKKGTRNLRHRASINGHAYNYKTSVFTPAFGSVTKVRVTSQNNAQTVIAKLFAKFRVENSSEDFSLYVVKETEERRELPGDEFPLISRVLVGPNEKLGKIFLQEKKMHKEISPEVAQYIKLDSRILGVFLTKFSEEEDAQIKRMKKRFDFYRKMLRKRIKELKQEQQKS